MTRTLFILLPLLTNTIKCENDRPHVQIGGLFQGDNEEIAFNLITNQLNKHSSLSLSPTVSKVVHHNAFNVLTSACGLLEKGLVGIFGPSSLHSSSYIQSVLDHKEIPHIETHSDPKTVRNSCLLNVHPHPSVLSRAYVDLVKRWSWRTFVAIYENEESLTRIGPLLSLFSQHSDSPESDNKVILLKQLETDMPGNYRSSLNRIKRLGEQNFVLDCSIDILEEVLKQAQQVGLMTENYNYIITNLDLQTVDLAAFQFSGTNITGFRMIDPENPSVVHISKNIQNVRIDRGLDFDPVSMVSGWKVRLKTALIVDAVHLFYDTLKDLTTSGQVILNSMPLYCNKSDNWKNGQTVINYMKGRRINGITGLVRFDTEGFRRDFNLDVVDLTPGGLTKIGVWNPSDGIVATPTNLAQVLTENEEESPGSLANKTFIVITCLTTPYGMLKATTDLLVGNDRFEGFGIDLIHDLSKMLGFNYTFIIQEDNYNGNYDPASKEWNGMIGEIIRGHADLAIADLTVTAERESVVDFTLQFMNLGISILYRKPEPVPPSLFMFASPFSNGVWLSLGVAYFLVSLSFFVMGRLSMSEWHNPYPCIEEPEYLINQFSIRNSLWFTVGSLMQQGTEIAPVGISTRTAAGVWWFFTLIMVSSYTANLAAFLTVETLVTSFGNLEELAKQTEIKYGAKRGGATASFFKDSGNDSVRNQIWKFMSTHDELMTDNNDEGVLKVETENYAYFMESTTIEYVVERHCTLSSVGPPLDDKGYAIAMKKNSPYRNELSTAILKLQETGRITALKEKWWREKRGAGNCGASDDPAATPLDLKNVGGVFLVLFLGTIMGFMGSVGELAFHIYIRARNRNISFKEECLSELKFFVKFKRNVKTNFVSETK